MIGFITGKVEHIDAESRDLIITTSGGVGYLVRSNLLCNVGDDVSLFIHTSVSENNIALWGFATSLELKLFKMLLSVSGIGPTSGASVIYSLGPAEFVRLLLNGGLEKAKVAGVGTKSMQKIILELKSKVEGNVALMQQLALSPEAAISENSFVEEAILGLVALGYDGGQVRNYFAKINAQGDTQELIKKFLSDYR